MDIRQAQRQSYRQQRCPSLERPTCKQTNTAYPKLSTRSTYAYAQLEYALGTLQRRRPAATGMNLPCMPLVPQCANRCAKTVPHGIPRHMGPRMRCGRCEVRGYVFVRAWPHVLWKCTASISVPPTCKGATAWATTREPLPGQCCVLWHVSSAQCRAQQPTLRTARCRDHCGIVRRTRCGARGAAQQCMGARKQQRTAEITASSMLRVDAAVPTPIVSPREIWTGHS